MRGGYSTITPDLVIEEAATGRSVPVDIKYKAYDVKKISTGDIYQTFLYAYALGDDPTERRAGILYPTTMPTYGALVGQAGQADRPQPAPWARESTCRGHSTRSAPLTEPRF